MPSTPDGPVPAPPHVLVLTKGLGLGGAERLLVEQATAASDVRFTVGYVRPDKTHFVDALRAADREVVALGGRRLPWPLALAVALRRTRPDVVHVHAPLVAAVARVLVRAGVAGRRAGVVSTEHNVWSAYRWPTRIANAVTMPLDHRTWAVSEEARASVRPAWLRRRVEVLRHGIDLAAVRDAARAEPSPPVPRPGPGPDGADRPRFTFVHVANHRPEKAHGVLLDAFALAAAADPDLHLWLVGQGLDDPQLGRSIAANAGAARITVLGYRADAPSLLARADALVLSSDHEGLPVAVMEALALGRPVVSTAVGGVPEAVRHDVEGLLVPRRDPSALADAMVALHREPERRHRLATAAAVRADAFRATGAHRAQADTYRRLAGR
ncbi:MAG TPA: glycosyltransferase [Aquihabitans sp.]|nr:glycosyltransferase [Aquihabitans sp.]